jgi:hypothetical protein
MRPGARGCVSPNIVNEFDFGKRCGSVRTRWDGASPFSQTRQSSPLALDSDDDSGDELSRSWVSVKALLTEDAKRWAVEQTCADRSYGARPLRRALQRYVEDPLSEALIEGRLTGSSLIEIYKADHDTGRTHVKS